MTLVVKSVRSRWGRTQIDILNLLLSHGIGAVRLVGTRTYGLIDARFSLLADFERLCILAKAILVLVLPWGALIRPTLAESVRSRWRRSQIDILNLLLSHGIGPARLVGTRSCGLLDVSLSLLADSERFDIIAELLLALVLAWSHVDILTLCQRGGPGLCRAHIYVLNLGLSHSLGASRLVSARSRGLINALIALLANSERLGVIAEVFPSAVVLTRAHIDIFLTYSKGAGPCWRRA